MMKSTFLPMSIVLRALRLPALRGRTASSSIPAAFVLPRDMPHVSVDVDSETGVAVVELTRHSKLNALSRSMARDVAAAVEALDEHPPVRAIVIAGGPRSFAAGADVEGIEDEGASTGDLGDEESSEKVRIDGGSWMDIIDRVKTPIVAAVDGFALGPGCGLALAADVVIAGQDAKFGVPDIRLGRVAGWGITQRLARAVGKSKAMEMVLSGRQMTADEAERSGLVSRLADAGRAKEEAIETASVIARGSKPVLRAAKECVDQVDEVGLREGILFEQNVRKEGQALYDFREGIRAFSSQRDPQWRHR